MLLFDILSLQFWELFPSPPLLIASLQNVFYFAPIPLYTILFTSSLNLERSRVKRVQTNGNHIGINQDYRVDKDFFLKSIDER